MLLEVINTKWGLRSIYISLIAILFLFPFFSTHYYTFVFYSGLLMGLAATGLNIIFGYQGLVSFGHATYFGIGAYTVALLMKHFNIYSMEVLLLAAIITTGLISCIIGFLCSRHIEVYFALITLGFGQVFYSLAMKFYHITGGTDGISIRMPTLLGFEFKVTRDIFNTYYYYYYGIFILIGLMLLVWIIINSPFGLILQTIRENSLRARFIGIDVRKYRWYAFTLSGIISGIAGALYAPLYGHVAPDVLFHTLSGELLFIALLGGYHSFIGPIIGGVVYTFIKTYLISLTSYYWNFYLGIILAIIILSFREGIMGLFNLIIRGKTHG